MLFNYSTCKNNFHILDNILYYFTIYFMNILFYFLFNDRFNSLIKSFEFAKNYYLKIKKLIKFFDMWDTCV